MDMNLLKRKNILTSPAGAILQMPDITAQGDQQDLSDPNDEYLKQKLDAAPTDSQPTNNQSSPSRLQDIYKQMTELPSGTATQTYKDFLSNQPNPENFKPGKMQRLAAILSGVSEGTTRGGGAGVQAANNVLDDPYNKALGQYNLKADRLAKAADIEEKDMGRRTSIADKLITADTADKTRQETVRRNDAYIANLKDEMEQRGVKTETVTDPNTGMKSLVRVDKSGKTTKVDLGKEKLTPIEDTAQRANTAGAESAATKGDKIAIAKAGIDERGKVQSDLLNHKFANIEDLLTFKDTLAGKKYQYKTVNGEVVAFNPKDPTDTINTGVKGLTEEQRAALKLKNEKELKQTPGPDTKTETKVSGNTRTVTKTSGSGSNEQVKPIPGQTDMEAVSSDGGKTWKARKKAK